jgi:hypothetical protein
MASCRGFVHGQFLSRAGVLGLQQDEKAIAAGAQTGRPDGA